MAGLYLHVPFCFHKCHYCDFYSIADRQGDAAAARQKAFTRALCDELRQASEMASLQPRTVFVGGGTPTLLSPDCWQQLLQTMNDRHMMAKLDEFTVEANPETVTPDLLRLLRDGGVNRVSLGVQSFSPTHLKTLERWHDPASVPRAVEAVRAAGIANINLDLIFAIPGQTLADVEADLDAALALEPTHLSCYSLIYEPNTAMTQRLKMGQFTPVDEETEREMYAQVLARLEAAGFEHYEISNWSRRDPSGGPAANACLHNLVYWHNENWLGCGPSAASHIDGHRWKNEAHFSRYIEGSPLPPTVDHEQLDADRRIGEVLMLSLRLRQGVALCWLADHLPPGDARHATIAELESLGFLERTATHLRLTHRALFVADAVIARLL